MNLRSKILLTVWIMAALVWTFNYYSLKATTRPQSNMTPETASVFSNP